MAIGKIAISLSVIAVFAKVFGFAEKLIVAHFFGTDSQADVYFALMGIILSVVFLVKELIYPSVLPVFAQTLKISFTASSALFKKTFFWMLLVLTAFAAVMTIFSDSISFVLVPGFSEDKRQLTSSMLRFLTPACLFLSLSTLTFAVLNCRRNFLKAAVPEAGFKLFVAAGLIVLAPLMGIYALAAVLTIAAVLVFVIQFLFIPEGKNVFGFNSYTANKEFHKILLLMGPLTIGVVFSHISSLVDNMLASTLPTGHLSYLGYSKKLIDAVLLIGPVALVTVVYSQLSHVALDSTLDEFKKLFIKALRLLLFVSMPASFVLVLLREPVIGFLFERGRFTAQSTLGTSQALFVYGIGFVTFSVEALVVYSFYALSNTKIPVRAGIFGVFLDIVLAVTFLKPFGFQAIAWAFVISKTVKVVILLLIIERKFNFLRDIEFVSFISKMAWTTSASAFALYILKGTHAAESFVEKAVFDLAVPVGGFALVFVACSYLFKINELGQLLSVLLKRGSLKYQFVGEQR
jgi:putative peptidoglycan lipid II flippase